MVVLALVAWAGALVRPAPLELWLVGPEDVEAELVRRAESVEPVQLDLLDLGAGRADRPWPEVRADAGELACPSDVFQSARIFRTVAEQHRQLAQSGAYCPCQLVSVQWDELLRLDDTPLGERFAALQALKRDPAAWFAAPEHVLGDRALAVDVKLHGLQPIDVCELEVRPGLERIRTQLERSLGRAPGDQDVLSALDRLALGRQLCARLEAASLTAYALVSPQVVTEPRSRLLALQLDVVRTAAGRIVCLQAGIPEPISLVEWVVDQSLHRNVLRQVEAAAPLLGLGAHGALHELVEQSGSRSRRDTFRRAMRAERVLGLAIFEALHEQHGGDGLGLLDTLFPGRPLHGDFLLYLRGIDDELAALALPYLQCIAQLDALERERAQRRSERRSSAFALDGTRGRYEVASSADALQLAAEIAFVALENGVDAARARAARTLDPFSDTPLRTRLREDGVFEVWSIGVDGLDDEASTATSANDSDADVVFRVLLMRD